MASAAEKRCLEAAHPQRVYAPVNLSRNKNNSSYVPAIVKRVTRFITGVGARTFSGCSSGKSVFSKTIFQKKKKKKL